jgi:hypothetical protein
MGCRFRRPPLLDGTNTSGSPPGADRPTSAGSRRVAAKVNPSSGRLAKAARSHAVIRYMMMLQVALGRFGGIHDARCAPFA